MLPFTPDQLLAIGSGHLNRAITLEHLQRNRARFSGRPTPVRPADTDAQVALEAALET